MRLDEHALERMADEMARFEDILTNHERHVKETAEISGENKQLRERLRGLEAQLASPEYKAKVERGIELDKQEANLKAALKLEYDKGYATAYAEVTSKMRA